jgi:ABC-2 type transport system ATP-binding protein
MGAAYRHVPLISRGAAESFGPAAQRDPLASSGSGAAMIAFEQLSKTYGEFVAVRDLDLSIGKGELFGFLGPNGAGKTTTIRMMMGILVPTAGRVTIDGLDCQADRVAVKRRVGYLPDNPMFYDYLRGREILEFVGEMHGQERREAQRRAQALLDEFGLADASEEFAVNYSTGMKKKLGLACAIIHDPAVLILDEPTNGLDPRASHDVQVLLRRSVDGGKTVFISTHLLDMAQRLCDRVAIIDRGALVAVGPLGELQEKVDPGGSLEQVFLKVTRAGEGNEDVTSGSRG